MFVRCVQKINEPSTSFLLKRKDFLAFLLLRNVIIHINYTADVAYGRTRIISFNMGGRAQCINVHKFTGAAGGGGWWWGGPPSKMDSSRSVHRAFNGTNIYNKRNGQKGYDDDDDV